VFPTGIKKAFREDGNVFLPFFSYFLRHGRQTFAPAMKGEQRSIRDSILMHHDIENATMTMVLTAKEKGGRTDG
jgi:hypothetical protein